MTPHQALKLVQSAASKWSAYNAPRLGASLAYYALLSMAPLLILMVAICGLVFNKNTAEQNLLRQIQALVGSSGAKALETLIESTHHMGSGVFATLIALLTLLFGASGVFIELRDSLNTIWEVPRRQSSGWRSIVWQRIVSFGMVLALGFLLLLSLIASAALTVAERFFAAFVPLHAAVWGEVANFVVSLAAIATLFGLIFKFVPDARICWRDVGVGAVVTAILFIIGKALLAVYLGTAGVGSAYGAAGSVVALVVWVYYSAQIFFFGAAITKVYADSYGSNARQQRPTKPLTATAASPVARTT
jgi:membrane protein